MYENEYEEYMRSVLGYPIERDTYNGNSFPYRNSVKNQEYESLYPDIYRMLKPMVNKVCENYRNKAISGEILESMATEIYQNIESDINVIGTNVSASENENMLNRNTSKNSSANASSTKEESTRGCCGNPTLKDLIKILLINQLINDNHARPPRPPFNPYPPRPPMPPRPPYRDMENNSYYDNYYNMNNL